MFDVDPSTRTDARYAEGITTASGAARLFVSFATPRLLIANLCVWVPLRIVAGDFGPGDLAILLGIAVYWPVQEWFAHAFVLHLRPRRVLGFRIDPLFARFHRWHHRHPHVVERIFVPWAVIVALTPVNVAIWWAITPSPARALTGIAAFTLATLIYEAVHYLSHVPVAPGNRYLKAVRRHHALHHFLNEHYWHAFTVPWLDRLLGTAPADPADAPRSPTVRTLGVED